jgi:hypothetical protein
MKRLPNVATEMSLHVLAATLSEPGASNVSLVALTGPGRMLKGGS